MKEVAIVNVVLRYIMFVSKLLGVLGVLCLLFVAIMRIAPNEIPIAVERTVDGVNKVFNTVADKMIVSKDYTSETKILRHKLGSGNSKLVVGKQRVELRHSAKSDKIIMGINFGRTSCSYFSEKNYVQYVTDLNQVELIPGNKNEVIVMADLPRLDNEIVEIDTSAPVECDIGLVRLESRSGKSVTRKLRKELRSKLVEKVKIDQGGSYTRLARLDFEKAIRAFLRNIGITSPIIFKYKHDQKKLALLN
ncbi:MAG: hypothetical protein KC478_10325 [Bacteriovoracaceae bacterium]|nr:hypothetical protein [Bacteriovoracaceae bacterium]